MYHTHYKISYTLKDVSYYTFKILDFSFEKKIYQGLNKINKTTELS